MSRCISEALNKAVAEPLVESLMEGTPYSPSEEEAFWALAKKKLTDDQYCNLQKSLGKECDKEEAQKKEALIQEDANTDAILKQMLAPCGTALGYGDTFLYALKCAGVDLNDVAKRWADEGLTVSKVLGPEYAEYDVLIEADLTTKKGTIANALAQPETAAKLRDAMQNAAMNWRAARDQAVEIFNTLDVSEDEKQKAIAILQKAQKPEHLYSTLVTSMTGQKAPQKPRYK